MVENAVKYSEVEKIEACEDEDVFCVYVEGNHSFISNGVVSHNCDALRYVIATHKVSSFDPYVNTHNPDEYLRGRFNQNKKSIF